MSARDDARLIGIDWGSSSLRAYLIDSAGKVVAERSTTDGASTLSGEQPFKDAFSRVVRDWNDELPVLACGMVGSRHGWKEAPYAACPVNSSALARQCVLVTQRLQVVPGILCDGTTPDVMRGEETQIFGALEKLPHLVDDSCLILPGTHSKWARLHGGEVISFATYMTGELFAVLRVHSVLARLMSESRSIRSAAFIRGVAVARDNPASGLTRQLFAVRTLGLCSRLAADESSDYLSGLLIGHEIAAGLGSGPRGPLAIVGEGSLCERYALALSVFGIDSFEVLSNTAPNGLAHIARQLNLLS